MERKKIEGTFYLRKVLAVIVEALFQRVSM